MKKRRIAICAKCDRERGIKARGLCAACYEVILVWDREALADYPTRMRDPSMDVDEVMVDRAVEWVMNTWSLSPAEREPMRIPHRLTLGEQVEVMRRTDGKIGMESMQKLLGAYSREVKNARKEAS